MDVPIRLGVSACLLGQEVRYNGGHCRDPFITGALSQYVEFVPVCPEVECGLPVPREAMRLVAAEDGPRLRTTRTRVDHTDRMRSWISGKLSELEEADLCGFIFKKGSPSSGMERVKIYNDSGMPSNQGAGLFAAAFMERFPLLPVEEEGRLNDPRLRENFIESIFTLKRWREGPLGKPSRRAFIEFHARNKLLLMAHSPKNMRRLGQLVARVKEYRIEDFQREYQDLLLETLRLRHTAKKHTDCLFHAMGFLKRALSGDEKAELIEVIDQYRQGHTPLIVPITLLNHYVRKYDPPYLKDQTYLRPHPVELKLRNHV